MIESVRYRTSRWALTTNDDDPVIGVDVRPLTSPAKAHNTGSELRYGAWDTGDAADMVGSGSPGIGDKRSCRVPRCHVAAMPSHPTSLQEQPGLETGRHIS
jgi:hypothetical protein